MPEAAAQPFVTSQRPSGVASRAATQEPATRWTWQATPNPTSEAGRTTTWPARPGYNAGREQNKLGNYYCWNRIYEPSTGRWTTPDPGADGVDGDTRNRFGDGSMLTAEDDACSCKNIEGLIKGDAPIGFPAYTGGGKGLGWRTRHKHTQEGDESWAGLRYLVKFTFEGNPAKCDTKQEWKGQTWTTYKDKDGVEQRIQKPDESWDWKDDSPIRNARVGADVGGNGHDYIDGPGVTWEGKLSDKDWDTIVRADYTMHFDVQFRVTCTSSDGSTLTMEFYIRFAAKFSRTHDGHRLITIPADQRSTDLPKAAP